jgi:hypothetical protein
MDFATVSAYDLFTVSFSSNSSFISMKNGALASLDTVRLQVRVYSVLAGNARPILSPSQPLPIGVLL